MLYVLLIHWHVACWKVTGWLSLTHYFHAAAYTGVFRRCARQVAGGTRRVQRHFVTQACRQPELRARPGCAAWQAAGGQALLAAGGQDSLQLFHRQGAQLYSTAARMHRRVYSMAALCVPWGVNLYTGGMQIILLHSLSNLHCLFRPCVSAPVTNAGRGGNATVCSDSGNLLLESSRAC